MPDLLAQCFGLASILASIHRANDTLWSGTSASLLTPSHEERLNATLSHPSHHHRSSRPSLVGPNDMIPPYQSEIIPWHSFVRHVQISSTSSSDQPEFALQGSSTIEGRDADFTVFASSLASAIADDAEKRRSKVPKPNAPVQAWRDLGVDDDALFPNEYLSRVTGMHNPSSRVPDPQAYTQKAAWEMQQQPSPAIGTHRAASALLVVVMTEPPDQFQFLRALLRLAQSIKADLTAMVGLHYSLPPRRSYEQDYDEGIVAYINLTLSDFLLVNIMLAVSGERDCRSDLLRFSQQSQSWNPPLAMDFPTRTRLDAASFEDRLHHDFWRNLSDGPRPTQPELLEQIGQYSDRCFNFLVSWYAVMMESFVTRRALGRTYPAYFGPEELTAVILLQLQNLGSAFNVHSLDASDPVAFVHRFNVPSFLSADVTPNGEDRGSLSVVPVPFLSLPPELHLRILAYLPTRTLLSVMRVCTQMRALCPELIYTNPIHIIDDFYHQDPGVQDIISRRFSKLLALLLARPELCLHLRTFTLRICDVPEDPSFSHSRYGFNINDPIVERMINLSHLDLFVPYPACSKCAARGSSWCKERLQHTIPDIIRRWPCLQALIVSYLPRDVVVSSLDHDTAGSPSGALRRAESENHDPTWSLQSLTIQQPDWPIGDPPPIEHQDLTSLHRLVKMNAHSLRRLGLHPQSLGALGDLQMFPICPLVDHLNIRSHLDGPSLGLFLERCFPVITFLHATPDWNFPGYTRFVEEYGRLDFSGCKLLRRAAVDAYPITGFPPYLESLDLGWGFNVNRISVTTHTIKAVQLARSAVRYYDRPDGDREFRYVCGALGRRFPALECLDTPIGIWDRLGTDKRDDMMDTLSSIVAGSLPNLSILILEIFSGLLSSRPRRSDFPSDDGGDRLQHDYAVVFFRACPALNVISFNGIPSENPPPFMQPDRVWRRATVDGEVEAELTSRESLPSKLIQHHRRLEVSMIIQLYN